MSRARRSPRSYRFLLAAGAVAFVIAWSPSAAQAQSPWMARDGEQTLMVEFLRPSIEGVNSKVFSGAFFLGGRGAFSPKISVVGELPFALHESTEEIFGSEYSSNTIGNPYAGLEMKLGSGPAFLEVGVRPPLAADDEFFAYITGIYSDVTRWEAFLPEAFSVLTAFNVREVTPSKIAYRLRVCPAVVIPIDDNNDDTTVWAIYSFQVGYHGSMARVGAGMSGRSQITTPDGSTSNLGERSLTQFEVHADFLSGPIRPGLDLRVPLGELGAGVPVVAGFTLTWTR